VGMLSRVKHDRHGSVRNRNRTGACRREWGQVRCQLVQIGNDGPSNGERGDSLNRDHHPGAFFPR
jgi:hypothetical protein